MPHTLPRNPITTSATGPILKNGVTLLEGSNKKSGPPRVDDPKHLCAARHTSIYNRISFYFTFCSSLKKFREMFAVESSASPSATRPSSVAVDLAKPAAAGRRARLHRVIIRASTQRLTLAPVLSLGRVKFPPRKTNLSPRNPLAPLQMPQPPNPPAKASRSRPPPSPPLPLAAPTPPPKLPVVRLLVARRRQSSLHFRLTTGAQACETQLTLNSVSLLFSPPPSHPDP
jgi:hypothetical protein